MLFSVRPARLGSLLGLVVVAVWTLLWLAFLAQLLGAPRSETRQPRPIPELARPTVAAGLKPGARSLLSRA